MHNKITWMLFLESVFLSDNIVQQELVYVVPTVHIDIRNLLNQTLTDV